MANLPPLPHGLDAVMATFGDPHPYADHEMGWEIKYLTMLVLPQPLIWSVNPEQPIRRLRAHKLIAQHMVDTLMACLDAGVPPERMKFGGAYAWRTKRGSSTNLSLHTWGIAIDIEPVENPMGIAWEELDPATRLDERIIDVFLDKGWYWGNDFSGRHDSQHWQFAEGV